MFAVIVCSLFSSAMLVGLLAGIVAGVWRARATIGEALAFDPLVTCPPDRVRRPLVAARAGRLRSA